MDEEQTLNEKMDVSDVIDKPKKIYDIVREYHSKKKFLESKDVLIQFLEKEPDSHVGNLYMGLTYLHLRETENAKKYFSHCYELSPNNYLVYDLDMLCDFMLGNDDIIKTFDLKFLHASSDFTAFLTMALVERMYRLKKEQGQEVLQAPDDDYIIEKEEATEEKEEATEEKEEATEDKEEATEDKEEATEDKEEKKYSLTDELMAFIYFNIAKFFSSREKFEKAEPYFEKAISRYDNLIRMNYSYGENLFFLKKYSEAVKQFEQAIEKEGDAPETMYYMGVSLKELGYFKKSQYYFKKAIEKFSNFPEVLFALGEIAIFEERYEDAFDLFYKTSGDASMLKELLDTVKEEILKKN